LNARDLRSNSPSHGENGGSIPLGSANDINELDEAPSSLSNICPIHGHGFASIVVDARRTHDYEVVVGI
jgi:hypothetical protein